LLFSDLQRINIYKSLVFSSKMIGFRAKIKLQHVGYFVSKWL